VDPRRLRRLHEPDDPIEPTVVGHREAGQAELDGALHQLVGRRCAVEEREARVAVELGVGHRWIVKYRTYVLLPTLSGDHLGSRNKPTPSSVSEA
jgi:hypothetical protein